MTTYSEEVQRFYDNFTRSRFSALSAQLAGRVFYFTSAEHDLWPAQSFMGRPEILGVMRRWHSHFANLVVKDLALVQASDAARRQDSRAMACLDAKYRLEGVYTGAIPDVSGLRRGRRAKLDVHDRVWLDDTGRVVRILGSARIVK